MRQLRTRQTVPVMCGILVVAVFLAGAAIGAEPQRSTPADQKTVSVTVYNDNLGLIKDVRDLSLPRGVLDLKFEGVAAKIDPTSVHIRSLSYPNALSVLEQNFEFDLISPAKLMEKYIGQTVELITIIDDK